MAELVIVLFGASSAETVFRVDINGIQGTPNVDVLVNLQAMVSFSCSDDVTQVAGSLNVNSVSTTLPEESDGVWIIKSMSLADQGAYECCVQSRCEEVAVISELNTLTRMATVCSYISHSPIAVLDVDS